jgi:hypothetical protein
MAMICIATYTRKLVVSGGLFAHMFMMILTFWLMCFCQILHLLRQRCWPIFLSNGMRWCTYDSTWDGHHCLLKFWSSWVPTFGGCSNDLLEHWCCANGVMNKNVHVMNDMILYHARTWVAWFLLREGTYGYMSTSKQHELTKRSLECYFCMCINDWFQPHTFMEQDLSRRAHRHFAKVNSF